MKSICLVFTLALFCGVVTARSAEPSFSIKLEGVLEAGEFFGPPDYGENPGSDRVEHSFFLQLPATPDTQRVDAGSLATLGVDAGRTYFVQIVVQDSECAAAVKALGHRVQVVGVPFVPITGHHRTPLLLDVKSLRPIDTWRW